jgi:hypothetical protein
MVKSQEAEVMRSRGQGHREQTGQLEGKEDMLQEGQRSCAGDWIGSSSFSFMGASPTVQPKMESAPGLCSYPSSLPVFHIHRGLTLC